MAFVGSGFIIGEIFLDGDNEQSNFASSNTNSLNRMDYSTQIVFFSRVKFTVNSLSNEHDFSNVNFSNSQTIFMVS